MPRIRRVIQSIAKPEPVGFDAQYWPILIAIAVLFGLLMGTVLTLVSGIWLWFSLIAIPVLIGSTSVALRFVDDRRIKRSTQLAMITSLIVHLIMLLSAHHWHLFGNDDQAADQNVEQKQPEKKKTQVAIPLVFETQQWKQSQQKLTPQPTEEQVEQPRSETEREIEKKTEPTPVDQTSREVTQNQNHLRKTQPTTPRQSESLSQLSRSNLQAQVKSGTVVTEAKQNSAASNPNPAENRPATSSSQRTRETKRTLKQPTKNTLATKEPTPSPSQSAVQRSMDRRQSPAKTPQTVAAEPSPTNRRNTSRSRNLNPAQPTEVAKSSVDPTRSERPSARSSAERSLEPATTNIAQASRNRQADQPATQSRQQTIAQRQPTKQSLVSRRPNQQREPKIAQAPASPTRVSNPTKIPNTTVLESKQSIVQSPRDSSRLNPQATNATLSRNRQVSTQPRPIQIEAPQVQTSALSQSATKASRRPNDTLPSITPNAPPDFSPRRSQQDAAQVASNTAVESPSSSSSTTQAARSEGQPRNTTLTKSTNGQAGVGQSANVQSQSPTSEKPSMVASDSAVRRKASQTTPRDTAFQPAQSAQVRRNIADRSTPSAEFKVENSPNAQFAGSENPAQLNAQSSASQLDASSNARTGRVNAAEGSSTLDTGATKLVSETGQGRASGGGQPDVDREIRTRSTQRSRGGQQTNNSLAANLKAETTEAPSELGGGRPSETTLDPNSTSLAKTIAGDGNQAAAGPSAAALSGPVEESSSAPSKSSATLAKTAPNEAADGDLVSGGGFPDPNPSVQRIRPSLAGANANTDVTFSGKAYTDREAGMNADDSESADRRVGANETSLPGRASRKLDGSGQSQASELLAGGSARSEGTVGKTAATRKQSDSNADLEGDSGSMRNQLAGRRSTGRGAAGTSGPKVDSEVELTERGGMGDEPGTGSSPSKLAGLSGQGDLGMKRRDLTGGQQVQLDVNEGPGGLGNQVASDTGINSRRARLDSTSIQLKVDTRFQRTEAGGNPKINTDAVFSKGAFKGRNKGQPGAAAPSTEPAIEMGLAWLAQQQTATGNWSLTSSGVPEEEAEKVVYETPTAATGLALLAFQGAGYNHKEYRYAEVVNKGVQWLVNNQSDDGCLYVETDGPTNEVCRLYSHGIAAIALCEAYGMTNDPEIKEAAQRSLDYIATSQDKIHGGWRYIPGKDSDTSVTGWMVMALKSGRLAGLSVNQQTLDRVDRWLGFAADRNQQHRFRYNPNAINTEKYPEREVQGKTPTACMTSVGLLLRLYSGWNRTDQRMLDGAKVLLKSMPSEDSIESRNTYYWYYATQVLKHVGGDYWETWYAKSLYPLLIRTQIKSGPMQGSWDPLNPVPDRWGYFSGRLYVTTLNLLTLEVKWRLLPLYEETVK